MDTERLLLNDGAVDDNHSSNRGGGANAFVDKNKEQASTSSVDKDCERVDTMSTNTSSSVVNNTDTSIYFLESHNTPPASNIIINENELSRIDNDDDESWMIPSILASGSFADFFNNDIDDSDDDDDYDVIDYEYGKLIRSKKKSGIRIQYKELLDEKEQRRTGITEFVSERLEI